MRKLLGVCLTGAALTAPSLALAQDITPASDTARFVLDAALMFAGALGALTIVFAFGLRDVGLARPQHTFSVCLRMMGLAAVTAIAFWVSGYNLFQGVEAGGFLGEFRVWFPDDEDPMSVGHPAGLHWVLHAGLAAVGGAVVSSAVSERVRLWAYLIFIAVYAGLIYPIIAGWTWGGGYFDEVWSYHDFAGAGVVHMTGGAAALAAAFVVGPRSGKYLQTGGRHIPSDALPLTAFGAGLIWVAWLLVIVSMVKSVATVEGAISIGKIATNALLAASGAVLAALFLTQAVYKRVGLVTASCAAVGGLVAISADPLYPSLWQAVMIGAVSGVIVTVAPPFLNRFRIDDAGLVVPTHLFCGGWGVISVAWTHPDAWLVGQVITAAGVTAFSGLLSMLAWVALKYTIGARLKLGGDVNADQSGDFSAEPANR